MDARDYTRAVKDFEQGLAILRDLESQGKLKNQPTYRYWLQEHVWMVLFCKALLLAEQGQHGLATRP